MSDFLPCWDVNCQTDGIQRVWKVLEPTTCPLDAGHVVLSVVPCQATFAGSVPHIHLHDPSNRVYQVTVDQNGNLVTTQVSGPAPA